MSTDVIMPQMGESIAEGTVTKWLKTIGDRVKRDEPLFEISTDKVDAEIPSPAEGVLVEILVKEGETVPINTVVARIGAEGEAKKGPAPKPEPVSEKTASAGGAPSSPAPAAAPQAPAAVPPRSAPAPAPAAPTATREDEAALRRKTKSSPVVQKIAGEHGVDISLLEGSGIGGRVTKKDILTYIEHPGEPFAAPLTGAAASRPAVPAPKAAAPELPAGPGIVFPAGEREVREKMSIMRKRIAEHMIMSRRTSAHVQSWQECDMHAVSKRRETLKGEFERSGVKLTFTTFIAETVVRALQAFPKLNASLEGEDTIVYHKDVNLGIAVSLDWGLIVPVVKQSQQMNLLGLATAINDLAERARTKRLSVDEVQSGTFTITNPGIFGTLMGAPIINQPQVAILGVGVIKKRPVVIDDAIAIRPIMYLSISYDHRLVDGADAAKFLAYIVKDLETPR
jgi:pyruvate dehydrogenase E2 component (dihydrolipoamide acetyltransferase)